MHRFYGKVVLGAASRRSSLKSISQLCLTYVYAKDGDAFSALRWCRTFIVPDSADASVGRIILQLFVIVERSIE